MSGFPSRVQLTQAGRFRVVTSDVCAARIDPTRRTVVTACGTRAGIDGDIPPGGGDVPVTCEGCKQKGEK